MSEQISAYAKEDIQRYIERRVPFPDVREELVNEMIIEVKQLLNAQEELKSYEAVDQIQKKYNEQYLESRINQLEKSLQRKWMKSILRNLLREFLHPGLIIMGTIAIISFLCLQFIATYILEILGGAVLLGFLVLTIYWAYYTYQESSFENRSSLFRKSFFAVHGSIFLFIWLGPFLLFDFIDMFVDFTFTINQTTDLITVLILSAALTLLYIEWKTYKTLLPSEMDTHSLHFAKN